MFDSSFWFIHILLSALEFFLSIDIYILTRNFILNSLFGVELHCQALNELITMNHTDSYIMPILHLGIKYVQNCAYTAKSSCHLHVELSALDLKLSSTFGADERKLVKMPNCAYSWTHVIALSWTPIKYYWLCPPCCVDLNANTCIALH